LIRRNESKEEVVNSEYRVRKISEVSSLEVAESPMLFFNRRIFADLLAREEIFNLVLKVPGDIFECGVYRGNGLMAFHALSQVLEPYNVHRKFVGFDTFTGFPKGTEYDPEFDSGYFSDSHLDTLLSAIEFQKRDSLISHVDRVTLVKGDARETLPNYLATRPHQIVALLYMDFDLYEPTKIALESVIPLIPKGGVIAFDQAGQYKWPGETLAIKEVLGLKNITFKRLTYNSNVSYIQV
jgi:hypothetical protein